MNFLLSLHPVISFFIVSSVSVLIALAGLILVRRNFHEQHLKENHEVAGVIFNAFGLLYAVLVAFVVYVTWISYDTSKKHIEMEVNKLSDLYLDAEAFEEPMKTDIRIALTEYTRSVVDEDWAVMSNSKKHTKQGRDAYKAIWTVYTGVDVQKIKNGAMYSESLAQLNAMSEFRRLRKFSSKNSTPLAIWIILLVGGMISITYTYFFGTRFLKAQCIMTASYTTMNAMVLFLIYILDNPFNGYSAISDEPFRAALKLFTSRLGQ
jgi:hypothetical protein